MRAVAILLAALFVCAAVAEEKPKAVRALIESCSGCSLNRLHEVRKFVKQEAAYYEPQVKVNFIGGRKPVIHFFDAEDNKIETVDLSPLTTKECLALLDDRGFKRNRAHPDDDTFQENSPEL